MATQLQFERKEHWVVATLTGDADISRVPERFAQIAQECERANTKRLIVDVSQAVLPASIADKFDMGRHTVIFARHGIKVAVVGTPDQFDPEKLGEVVAKNRGVNIRTFADIRSAEDWLRMD